MPAKPVTRTPREALAEQRFAKIRREGMAAARRFGHPSYVTLAELRQYRAEQASSTNTAPTTDR